MIGSRRVVIVAGLVAWAVAARVRWNAEAAAAATRYLNPTD
jgi:hypothetical protein